jgi:ABC-type transport system involved in multi-copper enzyme maturation permease subunit
MRESDRPDRAGAAAQPHQEAHMVGPVLHHEMLLGSRRSKAYIFRWIYAGWLVLQVMWFLLQYGMSSVAASFTGAPETPATGTVAIWFCETFVFQQLILLLLAVPVLAAGAITDEKTRGTLQYLMTTDVQPWHIVLGKLLGRVAQVGLIALAGVPLFCFLGAFAGVEPVTLIGVFLVAVMPLFALAAASLLSSVWSRQTRDAVLGLYVVGTGAFLLAWWLTPNLLRYFNPLYVLEPAWGRQDLPDLEEFGRRLLGSALGWGLIGITCFALAVWRLRPAYVRQIEGAGRQRKPRWWRVRRAPLTDNPITWKERHVEGLAPLAALRRVPSWVALVLIFGVTTASSLWILVSLAPTALKPVELLQLALRFDLGGLVSRLSVPPGAADQSFIWQGIGAMLIGSLVVGIRCSGAVTGERERSTWEALLLTPLTTRQLVRGKLWGIIGSSYLYLLAYAVPALAVAGLCGLGCLFWTLVWLAVTWLAMYFVGAAGLWCSVRSRGSWRSLLGTLGIGYVGGALVYLLVSPVIFLIALMIVLFLVVLDMYMGTGVGRTAIGGFGQFYLGMLIGSCVALAGAFWGLGWFFLGDAQKWIADRERTRHWKDEPRHLPPLRRREARPRFYR